MRIPVGTNGHKTTVRAVLVTSEKIEDEALLDDLPEDDEEISDEEEIPYEDDSLDDDATDEQKDAREAYYGLRDGTDAPWSPTPIRPSRDFLRDNPDAQINVVFPTVYEEDRSAKLKDLTTAQSIGAITHQRMSEQTAKELGFEQYDYEEELQAIQIENKRLPKDLTGAVDEIAGAPGAAGFGDVKGRGGNIGQPFGGGDSGFADVPEHRSDLGAPVQAEFRRQQKASESIRREVRRAARKAIREAERRLETVVERALSTSAPKAVDEPARVVMRVERDEAGNITRIIKEPVADAD